MKQQSMVLHVRLPFLTARKLRMMAAERGMTIGRLLDDLVNQERAQPSKNIRIGGPLSVGNQKISCVEVLIDPEDENRLVLDPFLDKAHVASFMEAAELLAVYNTTTQKYHLPVERAQEFLLKLQASGIEVLLSKDAQERISSR